MILRLIILLILSTQLPALFAQTVATSSQKAGAGNTLLLNGDNQFVNCGNIKELKGCTTFTLEAWINIRNYTHWGSIICNQGDIGNQRINLTLSGFSQGGNNNILFVVGDGEFNNANYNTTTNLITTGRWIHIAVSFDGTQEEDTAKIKMYINGEEQHNLNYAGFGKIPKTTHNNTKPFLLGSREGIGNYFDGLIDEVRFWKVVRTKQQIRENMHLNLRGSETGLVAYYQFDDAANSAEISEPVSGYKGILHNYAAIIPSNLQLSNGISKTLTITERGNYWFENTNCNLLFDSLVPQGDVVVTKMEGTIKGNVDGQIFSTSNMYDKGYWIIYNYGENKEITYKPGFHIEKNIISWGDEQRPANFILHSKAQGNFSKWQTGNGVKANSAVGLIQFPPANHFGTFILSSKGDTRLSSKAGSNNIYFIILVSVIVTGILLYLLITSINKRKKISKALREEKQITRAQAGEKVILEQEVHHRVKNNLTMLSSLIYLQSKTAQAPETRLALGEVQKRIQSMALVHQSLYSDSNEVELLDFKMFITQLFEDIKAGYANTGYEIALEITGHCDKLKMDIATPLALIMNELATNSFKYAFSGVRKPAIKVHLLQKGNLLTISYADNGPGLPRDFDLAKGGFGFKVLNILTRQLDATLQYTKTDKLAVFTLALTV